MEMNMVLQIQNLKQMDIVKKQIQFMSFMEIIGMETQKYMIHKIIIKLQIVHMENYIKKH